MTQFSKVRIGQPFRAGILAHVHTCGRSNVTDVIRGRAVTMRTVIKFGPAYYAAQDAAAALVAQGIDAVVSSPRSGEFEVYYDCDTQAAGWRQEKDAAVSRG